MQNEDGPTGHAEAEFRGSTRSARRGIDALEDAAERLEEAPWDRSDSARRAGRGAGPLLDGDDLGRLRTLLERQLHERPIPTLVLCVAAGWLAGKLLR